jgi:hypothetical protein
MLPGMLAHSKRREQRLSVVASLSELTQWHFASRRLFLRFVEVALRQHVMLQGLLAHSP